jgi:hypothetical protein
VLSHDVTHDRVNAVKEAAKSYYAKTDFSEEEAIARFLWNMDREIKDEESENRLDRSF